MNCQFLDHQVCIRADGQYRLCCISLETNNQENIKTHTIEDWLNSNTHKDAVESLKGPIIEEKVVQNIFNR